MERRTSGAEAHQPDSRVARLKAVPFVHQRNSKVVAIQAAAINRSNLIWSARLSSNQSSSYIVKKAVDPLIWTALKFNRPYGTESTPTMRGRAEAAPFVQSFAHFVICRFALSRVFWIAALVAGDGGEGLRD